jgi:hypothetical protein
MGYTDEQIEQAINNVKHKAPIAREYNGFIVLAQNELDFEGKRNRILRGDRFGFYTIKRALANGC